MIGDDNHRYKEAVGPPAAQTSLILPGGREYNGFLIKMIFIDIRRRWEPPEAQTSLILPGGREYNGFFIGDDINRCMEEMGPPAAQTSLILPGGREYIHHRR